MHAAQSGTMGAASLPAKKGLSTGCIIGLVVLAVFVLGIGGLVIAGIAGTRKYVANAKQAEARNALGRIAKNATVAFEENGRRMCSSASKPVPADRREISGKKYQSSAAEWQVDKAKNAGFACLNFEMTYPQYYQYEYEATTNGFIARARGDIDGNGVYSTFEVRGEVTDNGNGYLRIDPEIKETMPEE